MKDICPNCEKITELSYIKTYEDIFIGNKKINTYVEYYKCSECNMEFEDPNLEYDPLVVVYETIKNDGDYYA